MTKKEKIVLLEDMMELESGALYEDTDLRDIDEWDSLAAISLIVLVDEHFGKKLTADTIRAFKKISDILDIME